MPVKKQKMIYRADLQANPTHMFLFGDNDKRVGLGGQAKEMRGEENAVGIRTKWTPSMRDSAFFNDKDLNTLIKMIDQDLAPAYKHLREGGVVVIPADGLGTGLSDLPNRAPLVNDFLVQRLRHLETIDGVIAD